MSNNANGHDEGLEWLSVFTELTQLDDAAKTKLKKFARIVEVPVGTIGYREGLNRPPQLDAVMLHVMGL